MAKLRSAFLITADEPKSGEAALRVEPGFGCINVKRGAEASFQITIEELDLFLDAIASVRRDVIPMPPPKPVPSPKPTNHEVKVA